MNDITVNQALHVLGLPPGATHDQVRTAFRRKAREVHPDIAGPDSHDLMQELLLAREVLLAYPSGVDPTAYDATRQARAREAAERAAESAWSDMAAAWSAAAQSQNSAAASSRPSSAAGNGPPSRTTRPATPPAPVQRRRLPWGRIIVGGIALLVLAGRGIGAIDAQTSDPGECWADSSGDQVYETSCSSNEARWRTSSISDSAETCANWYVPLDNGRYACLAPYS